MLNQIPNTMKNKNNLLLLGVSAIAGAGLLMSFTEDVTKQKSFHVVTSQDGTITIHDTLVSMDSEYSIEEFLAAKNVNDDNVDIIRINGGEAHENVFFHHGGDLEFDDVNIDVKEENVQIMVEVDDDGNRTIKKTVNGEEQELTEAELAEIESHHAQIAAEHHGEDVKVEIDHKVEIICEVDDDGNKTVKKIVNGEEQVLSEDEIGMIHMELEDAQHEAKIIKVEIENLEEDIEKIIEQIDITEFKDGHDAQVIVKEIKKGFDAEGEELTWVSDGGHDVDVQMFHSSGDNFTIAIVTEGVSEVDNQKPNASKQMKMERMDVSVFPNPAAESFTLIL